MSPLYMSLPQYPQVTLHTVLGIPGTLAAVVLKVRIFTTVTLELEWASESSKFVKKKNKPLGTALRGS